MTASGPAEKHLLGGLVATEVTTGLVLREKELRTLEQYFPTWYVTMERKRKNIATMDEMTLTFTQCVLMTFRILCE